MAEKSRIAIMSVKSSHALGMAAYLRKKSQARVELLSTQERVESLIKGQANPPCILLIDSNVLPELDSSISLPQILSHIKQNCPIATVVVFATPDVLSARLALRRAGATHLLPFPIDREEVYTIVQQALGQRRSLQALEKAAHTVVLAAEQRARTLRNP